MITVIKMYTFQNVQLPVFPSNVIVIISNMGKTVQYSWVLRHLKSRLASLSVILKTSKEPKIIISCTVGAGDDLPGCSADDVELAQRR